MLRSIRLKNYKGFLDTKEIEIKPITLILGKNSSGKSSICKLFPILRDALKPPFAPLPLVSKEGVRLAWRYQDLFHKKDYTNLEFQLNDDDEGIIVSSFFWSGKALSRLRFSATKGSKGLVMIKSWKCQSFPDVL